MDARELRIGNHAKHFENGIVLTVGRTVAFKTPTNTIRVDVDDLEPIPLTEEWLLKLGFKKKKQAGRLYDYYYIKDGLYYSAIDFHNWVYKNNSLEGVKIKYIHQLQNLYHALTNEELTLNK